MLYLFVFDIFIQIHNIYIIKVEIRDINDYKISNAIYFI